jgi:hypothetical protein
VILGGSVIVTEAVVALVAGDFFDSDIKLII